MSNPYEQFQTNPKLEKDGIILDYSGYQITIARAGGNNKDFQRCAEMKARAHKTQIRNETISADIMHKLLIETYAQTVVKSWKGVKDESGKIMEFTYDNCVKLFTDLPELFADVRDSALNAKLFNKHLMDTDSKK
jgi:hypothetical protein